MTRIGLTLDELLATTWASGVAARYAARLPGLDVLEGETVALVGEGAGDLVDAFAGAVDGALPVDGGIAAQGGALRIHAQQAGRVGVRALAVSDPFPGLGAEAKSLAVADLASFARLGLTTVVAASDRDAALLFADRVVLLRAGRVQAAYPVVAAYPRTAESVAAVADRLATFAAEGRARPPVGWALMFIDEVKVHVKGGRGGSGVTSFAKQPFEPRGRPDGGDGGNGGHVIVRATHDVQSLVDYHHRPHRAAGAGRNGEGDLRRGADGDDVVLLVPLGTVVKDADGRVLADLLREGAEYVVAQGGRGGRGNAAFRTSSRRAPMFHEFGEPPQEGWVVLELKLVADVALVGFPNAGKSSLIARLSAAKPKIADYPFTTLTPNLGVVRADDMDFVVADVPGLIEGASEGRGLGHQFLRHVERAGALVHVLDCATYEQRDPREDLRTVVAELRAYMPELLERPALVFLNKADVDPDTAEIILPDLVADGWEVIVGSAVTGAGVEDLRWRMAALVRDARQSRAAEVSVDEPWAEGSPGSRPVLRPAESKRRDFTIERDEDGWLVRGDRIERWIVMADLTNDEAVRYLQGRLVRAGVERALADAGAERGDTVRIAGAVFDFEPDRGDVPDDDVDDEAEVFDDDALFDDDHDDLDDRDDVEEHDEYDEEDEAG